MTDKWEICGISVNRPGFEYYSEQLRLNRDSLRWKDFLSIIATIYPTWLQANPKYPIDLIPVLLKEGWEPYAVTHSGDAYYYFRRRVSS